MKMKKRYMGEYERMEEYRRQKEARPSKEVLDAITQGRETGYALGLRDAAGIDKASIDQDEETMNHLPEIICQRHGRIGSTDGACPQCRESDTPRTDAAVDKLREQFPGVTMVPGDFARQLEREIKELRRYLLLALEQGNDLLADDERRAWHLCGLVKTPFTPCGYCDSYEDCQESDSCWRERKTEMSE